jgi:hypothetical protein
MKTNRIEVKPARVTVHGVPHVPRTSHELVDQFKLAFADENAADFVRLISQLESKTDTATSIAVLKQIDVLLRFHGDLLQRWCEEDPGMAKAMQQLGQLLQRMVDFEE